ncbi:4618_t:CDS:2, partial [Gigaspora rosea]
MPPKRKTPPTPPHIANDDSYRQPSPPIVETEKQKSLRLDRKRKAVTKWYRANPTNTVESSTSISAMSTSATTSTIPLATTSTTPPSTILATLPTTTSPTILATTSAIPLATILAPTPTTTFTSPLVASLDSVTASADAFAESTTFDLSQNLQQRESNRIRQQQYRHQLTPNQQIQLREQNKVYQNNCRSAKKFYKSNKFKNNARCSLDDFNLELDDGFDINEWQHRLKENSDTKLTKFFEICLTDPNARNLLYTDFPKYFVWSKKQWKPQKLRGDKTIARMFMVNPKDEERYCLRLLLTHIKGPTFFKDLRTINNILYPSFKMAAIQLGLLENDQECDLCLRETLLYQMPKQLRQLFATILIYCRPTNILKLWNTHLPALSEDFVYNPNSKRVALNYNDPSIVAQVLLDLEKYFFQNGKSLLDFPELPTPDPTFLSQSQERATNQIFFEETNYDQNDIAIQLSKIDTLNNERK